MNIKAIQNEIACTLGVNAGLKTDADFLAEIERRKTFIKDIVRHAGVQTLVLGISGGVDSLTAGLLCQAAAKELRNEGMRVEFMAVRLPYQTQRDEVEAQRCMRVIQPDLNETVNIAEGVNGLMGNIAIAGMHTANKDDFVRGNVKARLRMVAQYALANYTNGLVVGTDHAAEAVMGFYTKFGDGACDLDPLSGLVKSQVRRIAMLLGAPEDLAFKTPTADLEDLAPGKPDEAAYGCTYEEIDSFLLGEPVSDQVAKLILTQYQKTAHKRVLPFTPN